VPVVTFAFYTGCRKGEILSLQWSQFDEQARMIRLEPGTTKNDEGRSVPLVNELFDLLVSLKRQRDESWPRCPWIFTRAGTPIKDFRGAWDKACRAAKLVDGDGEPNALFHDLRRTGVRNLVRAGVPEAVAMRISGHKTRSVFDRYNIVNEADLKDAAAKLQKFLGGKD
jgi:integrase